MTGTAASAVTHYSYCLQAGMATVTAVVIPNLWSKNMNREDITRIAREAGLPAFIYPNLINEIDWARMEHFVSLVYAEAHQHGLDDFETTVLPIAISAEREACAKVAWDYGWKRVDNEDVQAAAVEISEAIQARGK